jgi:CDGSH-type Zn-finger protein
MPSTRILVRNDGPIVVEGDFEIVDAEGRPFGLGGRTKVTLCRCGQSNTKPFCDGTHKECAFASVIAARDLPPPAPKPAAAPAPPAASAPAPDETAT